MAASGPPKLPFQLFISYSREDERFLHELEGHLASMQHEGLLKIWDDRELRGGDTWEPAIEAHLNAADIILLLISSAYLGSRYGWPREMPRALQRYAEERTVVIPVLLRPVDWENTRIGHLNALPRGGKAVTEWPSFDLAFTSVAHGVRDIVDKLIIDGARAGGVTAPPSVILDISLRGARTQPELGQSRGAIGRAAPSPQQTSGYVQRFEKGSVYWSEASRARAVFGAIGELYEAVGGTAGTLGFPRSDEGPTEALVDGKSGARQKFEGGSIYWHAERTAILIWGRFAEIYEADREIAVRLGFPKSAQVEQSSDRPRRWQRFDRGWLVSIDNGRPFPLVSSNSETLDEAAVNPRHTSDLGALHPSYALQNVLSDESIAIVIGTWVGAELLDRPVAAVLRDAIDRRGDSPFQRAVVVTDYRWFEEKDPRMRMRPAISVGGPDINSLAAEIVKDNGKHTFGEGWWSQSTSDQFERIALWGTGAPATRQVLESFMESPAMEQFLNRSWKRRF